VSDLKPVLLVKNMCGVDCVF